MHAPGSACPRHSTFACTVHVQHPGKLKKGKKLEGKETHLSAFIYLGQRAEQGPRVCILGGGFGGLYTALRLDSLLWPHGSKPQVTLIDRSERFVFKPLLYELLNGGATEDEVAPPFRQLLAPYSINFIQVWCRFIPCHVDSSYCLFPAELEALRRLPDLQGSVSAVELEGAENSGDNAGDDPIQRSVVYLPTSLFQGHISM